ncbi:hypothetical protein CRUP_011369 [Coryphaenoides rupestris]|nr:hypothetical protein CRUP_011369 [Coryphaenoides rupestris]
MRTGTPWCAPIKVKHGDVSCRTPRGERLPNVMGTRCKVRCKRGYETESPEVVCMASKHWSSSYACHEIRCRKLNMPLNGGFKCSDGSYFNSRCEFFCSPGYTLKGQKTTTCQHTKMWTAEESTCIGEEGEEPLTMDPGPEDQRYWEVLTVTRDQSVILKGRPSKSDFPEGLHKMSYSVFDRAGNKGTCRFSARVRVRRCSTLFPADNGYMKCDSDGDNYGATCQFTCTGGHELQGSAARVCQYGLSWRDRETGDREGGEEETGGDRRREEETGGERRRQEERGGDRRREEETGGGGDRRREEKEETGEQPETGGDRRRQGETGGDRRRQGETGGDRGRQEETGGDRGRQEETGGDRRRQGAGGGQETGGERRRQEETGGDRRRQEETGEERETGGDKEGGDRRRRLEERSRHGRRRQGTFA